MRMKQKMKTAANTEMMKMKIKNMWVNGYTDLEYRESKYFNEHDTYVFQNSLGGQFKSKVEHTKGSWFTIESLEYKATTLPCKSIS